MVYFLLKYFHQKDLCRMLAINKANFLINENSMLSACYTITFLICLDYLDSHSMLIKTIYFYCWEYFNLIPKILILFQNKISDNLQGWPRMMKDCTPHEDLDKLYYDNDAIRKADQEWWNIVFNTKKLEKLYYDNVGFTDWSNVFNSSYKEVFQQRMLYFKNRSL